jgi:cell wall-associated NlpC family hydrolase
VKRRDALIRELVAAHAYLAHMRLCPGDGPIRGGIQQPWNMSPPPVEGTELTELPNGQTEVTGGFDCSGLTQAAYQTAGIDIPRTAQTPQYNAGPRVPAGQPIAAGDLVFFGASPSSVTHVGIAISSSEMINAPHRGAVVRIESIWRSNYLGATRPAAGGPRSRS